jgi:hypothetical protein
MHPQLSYTAAKFEIADRQRRAQRELPCGQPVTPNQSPRRGPRARLVSLWLRYRTSSIVA